MRNLTGLASALTVLALLAGCGQKGPLYLPGDEEAAEQYDPAEVYDGSEDIQDNDIQGNENANTTREGEG